MQSNVVAYYLWPLVWIGAPPPLDAHPATVAAALGEEVYFETLPSNIVVHIYRDGQFVFDFTGWSAGLRFPDEMGEANALEVEPGFLFRYHLTDTSSSESSAQTTANPIFDQAAAVILQRLELLNAYLCCLYTSLFTVQHVWAEKMILGPSDLMVASALGEPYFADIGARSLVATARIAETYLPNLPIAMDWRLERGSQIITPETLAESFRLLNTVIGRGDASLISMVDMYMRAYKALEDHNYSVCLVLAWAITEQMIDRLWDRLIGSNREREIEGQSVAFIDPPRKQRLDDTRTYTAGVRIEMLSWMGLLPLPLYQALASIRKARNDWIHSLKSISRQKAELSVSTAEELFSMLGGVKLALRPVLRLYH